MSRMRHPQGSSTIKKSMILASTLSSCCIGPRVRNSRSLSSSSSSCCLRAEVHCSLGTLATCNGTYGPVIAEPLQPVTGGGTRDLEQGLSLALGGSGVPLEAVRERMRGLNGRPQPRLQGAGAVQGRADPSCFCIVLAFRHCRALHVRLSSRWVPPCAECHPCLD